MTSPSRLCIGIDIAKDTFTAAWHRPGEAWHTRTFDVSGAGMRAFRAWIEADTRFPEGVLVGMEASGPYTLPVLHWFLRQHSQTVLLNPLSVRNFSHAQSLRRTKTDKIDARAIATYLERGESLPEPVTALPILAALAKEYDDVTRQVARLKTQIRQMVHVLFPELPSQVGLFSRGMVAVLAAFPSARAMREAGVGALAESLRAAQALTGKPLAVGAEELCALAETSLGIDSPTHDALLASKLRRLVMLCEEQRRLQKALIRQARQAHPDDWQILVAMPGIGDVTAALFLAYAGQVARFDDARAVTAFAGLDPSVAESGQHRAPGKITKRGSRHLRRTLFLMAKGVIRRSPTFRAYYAQLRARGKCYRAAVVATANKLIRVLYTLLTRGVYFQEATVPGPVPAVPDS